MTTNPACCTPQNSVEEAAQMMVKHDCGEIPVVESKDNPKPIGVITDRDITCRVVATGKNPSQTRVGDAMSTHPLTFKPVPSTKTNARRPNKNQTARASWAQQRGS